MKKTCLIFLLYCVLQILVKIGKICYYMKSWIGLNNKYNQVKGSITHV